MCRVTDKELFAAKIETVNVKKEVLCMDLAVLKGAKAINSRHFCRIEDRGNVPEHYKFIVMQLVCGREKEGAGGKEPLGSAHGARKHAIHHEYSAEGRRAESALH